MNVRYFSVARDSYEAGDCPVCARCGANMRHVTEVNGRMYGSGCGKIVIEEITRTESNRAALIAEASKTIPAARVNFQYWTVEHIQSRIASCEASGKSEYVKAWQALLQAKNAA